MQDDQAISHLLLDPALQELRAGALEQSIVARVSNGRISQDDGLARGSSFAQIKDDGILHDYQLAVERAQTWTGMTRFGFNAMLASPQYKNKLRLKPERMERIIHFLTVPDAKSRENDRMDAQSKHQSQRWIYENGNLYRKESRLQQPRRHVSANEVFDILTAEHLRSGHHGRDKMLKLLEVKYIGYTKDELMYVLERCLVCSAKHIRGAAARRKKHKRSSDVEVTEVMPAFHQ